MRISFLHIKSNDWMYLALFLSPSFYYSLCKYTLLSLNLPLSHTHILHLDIVSVGLYFCLIFISLHFNCKIMNWLLWYHTGNYRNAVWFTCSFHVQNIRKLLLNKTSLNVHNNEWTKPKCIFLFWFGGAFECIRPGLGVHPDVLSKRNSEIQSFQIFQMWLIEKLCSVWN